MLTCFFVGSYDDFSENSNLISQQQKLFFAYYVPILMDLLILLLPWYHPRTCYAFDTVASPLCVSVTA